MKAEEISGFLAIKNNLFKGQGNKKNLWALLKYMNFIFIDRSFTMKVIKMPYTLRISPACKESLRRLAMEDEFTVLMCFSICVYCILYTLDM